MRDKWVILAICILLAGCQPEDTSVSHRDILDDYRALNIRLESLAYPLLKANQDICDQTYKDDGIRWHQLADYPEDLQAVAQSYWGVNEKPSVFYVLSGSVADKAGIAQSDRPSDERLMAMDAAPTICKYSILVSYIDEINAYATGNEIIVTSGMLRSIDDDHYLTLVLAHELSHNILDHIGNPSDNDKEAEADAAAVNLMARAGLDFEKAIESRIAYQRASAGDRGLSKLEKQRIEKFKLYSEDVKTRQKNGKALWP